VLTSTQHSIIFQVGNLCLYTPIIILYKTLYYHYAIRSVLVLVVLFILATTVFISLQLRLIFYYFKVKAYVIFFFPGALEIFLSIIFVFSTDGRSESQSALISLITDHFHSCPPSEVYFEGESLEIRSLHSRIIPFTQVQFIEFNFDMEFNPSTVRLVIEQG